MGRSLFTNHKRLLLATLCNIHLAMKQLFSLLNFWQKLIREELERQGDVP